MSISQNTSSTYFLFLCHLFSSYTFLQPSHYRLLIIFLLHSVFIFSGAVSFGQIVKAGEPVFAAATNAILLGVSNYTVTATVSAIFFSAIFFMPSYFSFHFLTLPFSSLIFCSLHFYSLPFFSVVSISFLFYSFHFCFPFFCSFTFLLHDMPPSILPLSHSLPLPLPLTFASSTFSNLCPLS